MTDNDIHNYGHIQSKTDVGNLISNLWGRPVTKNLVHLQNLVWDL